MAAVDVLASAATLIYTPAGGRETVVVQNLGPNDIYVDYSSTVTSATGLKIAANGTYSVGHVRRKLYARAVTADQVAPANTRILTEPDNVR